MSARPWAMVAEREVRQRLRGKTFRATTLLMLVAVGAAIVIPTLGRNAVHRSTVGITGELSSQDRATILATGRQIGVRIDLVGEPSSSAAITALANGSISVAVLDDSQVLVDRTLSKSDVSIKAQVARALALLISETNAREAAGLTPAQSAAISHIEPVPVRGLAAAKSSTSDQGTVVFGMILLFVLLSQYGTWTLIGVMEEKASRVVEVLLAAVRPTQLLAGKVLGIGALVFMQASILVGFGLGVAEAVGSNVLHGTAPTAVLALLAWLALGYAFYSWVFAAAGSMVERQDQVQAIAFPITIPLLVGYVSSITAVTGEHASTYVTTLAYLPPTAPFAMPVLVSLHAVAWWQFALSALISVAATVGTAKFAGLVYRRAVLRTGRRVSLREVLVSRAPTRSR